MVGGDVYEMTEGWDIDEMSYIGLSKLVKSLGYITFKCTWYRDPKLNIQHGLRPLKNNGHVLKLITDCKGFEVIGVYVENLVDVSLVVVDSENENEKEKGREKEKEEKQEDRENDDSDLPVDNDLDAESEWTQYFLLKRLM